MSQAGLGLIDGVVRELASVTVGYGAIAAVVGGIAAVVAAARVGLVDGVLAPEPEPVQASVYAPGPAPELEHASGLGPGPEGVAVVAVGAVSVAASAIAAAAGTEVWEPGEGAESVVVEVPAGLAVRLAALLPSGFRV